MPLDLQGRKKEETHYPPNWKGDSPCMREIQLDNGRKREIMKKLLDIKIQKEGGNHVYGFLKWG